VQEYTTNEISDGIKERNSVILDFIYEKFFYQIKAFIKKNSGSDEDAQDVYQDAILVIYQKLTKENLKIDCSFNTYLYSVCRLIWLKKLEKRKKELNFFADSENFINIDGEIEDWYELNERYQLYQEHFKKLSFNCQKILELFLARIPLKEIARILGLRSELYVKKRKHICKEKLVENIKKDPKYNSLRIIENQFISETFKS
jgi:RNA polymerase sigma factor (sigma-70 family)